MKKVFTIFVMISIFLSCKQSSTKVKESNSVDSVPLAVTKDSLQKAPNSDSVSSVFSSINAGTLYTANDFPLPADVYIFMKTKQPPFNKNILVPAANAAKCITEIQKGIYLGFYSADLAYCTVFSKNQESAIYLNAAKSLSDGLGIPTTFDQKMIDRFNNNLENYDSLRFLVNNLYLETCKSLENNTKGNALPFIVAGSWIETMHLLISLTENTALKQESLAKITQQIDGLDKLLKFLNNSMLGIKEFKINSEMIKVVEKLTDIQNAFAEARGSSSITDQQFKNFTQKIKQLRDAYAVEGANASQKQK